jgi:putative nucleotidyltransferase with HDIG domain
MNLPEKDTSSDLLSKMREVIDPAAGAFLVGGVVRDQLTNTACHDIDLILPGETKQIARRAADLLGGKFFPLDESRGMYRILLTGSEGQIDMVDISRLQAVSLDEDLRLRDFTVNAIAVGLHKPDDYIDPLNGRNDLKNRVLRPCSDFSLENDPVRVIRAARMSLEYNLRFAPGLSTLIRSAGTQLKNTSIERQRDEIFKILDGGHPVSAIRLLDSFGVLSLIFPGLAELKGIQQSPPHTMDVFEHTLTTMEQLKLLLDLFLSPNMVLGDGGNLTLGLTAGKIGIFKEKIIEHFHISLNPFRTRKSLVLFGALFHDIGKSSTRTIGEDGRYHFYKHESLGAELVYQTARSMALSEAEADALKRMVGLHMRPRMYSMEDCQVSRRTIYRFYRQAQDYGVDTCLLSLADYLAKTVHPPKQDDWIFELDRIALFLEGWFFQKQNWVEPVRLVGGEEIMTSFNLPPGQMIGEIIASIQEAQAAGKIVSREEALELAKMIIFNPARELDE